MHIENTLGRYYVHKDFWGKEKKYIMFEHVKLKELCTVNQGLQIPISKRLTEPGPNRYFYITVQFLKNNIENYYIENPPIATTCNKDEILMVRTGNTGQVITGVEGCFHNNFFKVKPNDRIIPKYLYYVLKSDLMYKRVLNAASGTTIPDLKHSSFYELDIPLPMIETQKKISEMLECIDKKIENNEAINRNLEDQVIAIYYKMFVETKSEKRTVCRAEEVFNITIGKTPPRKEKEWFSSVSTDRVWISISDMGSCGTFINDSSEYLTQEAIEKFNVKVVPDNTVILSFKLTVGRIAITVGSTTTNEAIAHFNTDNDRIVEYLYCYLKSFDFGLLGSTSSIGTAVNSKTIKAMDFVMPEERELQEFYEIANPIFKQIKNNQFENQNLISMRDYLLPRLMSGELDVSDLKA